MSSVFRCVLMTLIFLSDAAKAADDDWHVAKTTSRVKFTLDQENWSDVHVGGIIPTKASLSTRTRGRLRLTRGAETISLQPDTLACDETAADGKKGRASGRGYRNQNDGNSSGEGNEGGVGAGDNSNSGNSGGGHGNSDGGGQGSGDSGNGRGSGHDGGGNNGGGLGSGGNGKGNGGASGNAGEGSKGNNK